MSEARVQDIKARRVLLRYEEAARRTSGWRTKAVEYYRAYNSDQWTQEEKDYLKAHKRFPVTINITAPVVDGMVSMMAANSPRYKAIPSNRPGTRIAAIADFMLEYNCYISHFPHEFVQACHDYGICGIGWMQADVDTTKDYGLGEVVNRSLSWTDVYWDWRAKRPGLRDSGWVIVYNEPAAKQLKVMFPDKKAIIDHAVKVDFGSLSNQRVLLTSATSSNLIYFPGDITGAYSDDFFDDDEKLLPVLEHYEIVYMKMWVLFDPVKGYPEYYTEDEYKELEPGLPIAIKERKFSVTVPRVLKTVVLGGMWTLEEYIMPISELPVVPIVKLSNGSSLPQGIVQRIFDIQTEQNKRRMAIVENAMATSAGRLLAPKNSIDKEEWDVLSRMPGALIEYKSGMAMEKEPFIQLQAQSLPNQFYHLEQTTISLMEYVSGIDSLFLGSTKNMPDTYRQSLMIEDYGTRKIKAIDMTAVDSALEVLGQVTLELDQWWYDYEKQLSIVDDEGMLTQVVINRKDIDQETGAVRGYLDSIRDTKFQVRIITGSTMPTNKYAILELYLSLFDRGLIDEESVLRQTDITNIEEVLQRVSKVQQLSGVVNELQEQNKEAEGLILRLKNQLVSSEIKDAARTMMEAEQLTSLNRQMKEKLAGAVADLSVRSFQQNVTRTEKWLEEMAKVRTRNLLDRTEDRLRMTEQVGGSGTATSK